MTADHQAITLDDKYELEQGRVLISGRQALVRLPLAQREFDRRRGLKTACYISGYRGSPLGGYDAELWKAGPLLKARDILFAPGLNEDLALAAVAGTQQIDFVPGKKVDGVVGFWYGKGPGVDRSGDAIKHANLSGTSSLGGVVLLFGDDHAGKSSTTAHQSDLTLASWGVPILYPSSVTDILELGLAAVAMSRYSGLLVGLKLVNETAESTGVLDLAPREDFLTPDLASPPGGIHIRPEMVAVAQQETRLERHKLPRAAAFARANRLDRIQFGAQQPRFLVATAGKAFADVLAALEILGLNEAAARRIGLAVYKIALIFPLDPESLIEASRDAEEILFVEEKRAQAEDQAKALLFNAVRHPRISGKTAPGGAPLLPPDQMLNGDLVAAALADRLSASIPDLDALCPGFAAAAGRVRGRIARPKTPPAAIRRPDFCPGCPHNSSTKVPDGAIGATGIGCHGMVVFHPERNPLPMGHMGAEGANWIGLANFTETPHIFQNLGDGTYNHSGSLAIRAAVQAGTAITYKILFNDAVAMTGGQPVEGALTVAQIVRQVMADGVRRVFVLSEDPERFSAEPLPRGTELRHRDDLAPVQEELRQEHGVSVLIFDQVCAAEKRRRRKIGTYPNPDQRLFINALVCEGCGDCSVQSSCMAIQPLETDLGLKRKIDQSACNKDFSCVKGFCPSFVTVEGGKPRKTATKPREAEALPSPILPALGEGFDMLITGVGGTGVVTVGAILGLAARIEGLGVNLFDMTGLSQKGGTVFSHVRLRPDPAATVPAKIGQGQADLILACDLVAAIHPESLETLSAQSVIVANTDIAATADFQSKRDLLIDPGRLVSRLAEAGVEAPVLLAATSLAEELFGDTISANLLMLGAAWQRGAVPLRLEAIEEAIRLNGKGAQTNLAAFAAGRRSVLSAQSAPAPSATLDGFIEERTADLVRYWNQAYGRRYQELMARLRGNVAKVKGGDAFTWAVARSAYKLMAYKDEYEVARLYSDGRFQRALAEEFEGTRKIRIHLAPPLLARRDPATGRPRKIAFGGWILRLLPLLAALRSLREGPLDIFGRSAERRLERALRDRYLALALELSETVTEETLERFVELAAAPLDVRGFGVVKMEPAKALLQRLEQ